MPTFQNKMEDGGKLHSEIKETAWHHLGRGPREICRNSLSQPAKSAQWLNKRQAAIANSTWNGALFSYPKKKFSFCM